MPQASIAHGDCNPVIARDPISHLFIASPTHLGFRLHVNTSFAALIAAPSRLDAFVSSTRNALSIAFQGPLNQDLSTPAEKTRVYIRGTAYASAWPDLSKGKWSGWSQ